MSSNDSTSVKPQQERDWRPKDRTKTLLAGIILCLELKPSTTGNENMKQGYAMENLPRLDDTFIELSGKLLQRNYENINNRIKCKHLIDPTVEELKQFCTSLRKNCKDERLLIHYNGLGVSSPTLSGELWVFNKQLSENIPVKITELFDWINGPVIFLFDCDSSANLINSLQKTLSNEQSSLIIQFASCSSGQKLPKTLDFPLDIFSCCMTDPIITSIKWHVKNSFLSKIISNEMILKIPGKVSDRRSPLGEITAVFNCITDAIAWDICDRSQYKELFRQDVLVAGLFRNFIFASRMLRSLNITPTSFPLLPNSTFHVLWDSWDLYLDLSLSQIPNILSNSAIEYVQTDFFACCLQNFENYIFNGLASSKAPIELPMMSHIIHYHSFRVKALDLLVLFMKAGNWAIKEVLDVGLFSIFLKLLHPQLSTPDIRTSLLQIWGMIISFDPTVQVELSREDSFMFFACTFKDKNATRLEHCLSAFVISFICLDNPLAQSEFIRNDFQAQFLRSLNDEDEQIRIWSYIGLGVIINGQPDQVANLIKGSNLKVFFQDLKDPFFKIRASVLFLFGNIFSTLQDNTEPFIQQMLKLYFDPSSTVRLELVNSIRAFVSKNKDSFIEIASEHFAEESLEKKKHEEPRSGNNSTSLLLWKCLLMLSVDSFHCVATSAMRLVDEINSKVFESENQVLSKDENISNLFSKVSVDERSISKSLARHYLVEKRALSETSRSLDKHDSTVSLPQITPVQSESSDVTSAESLKHSCKSDLMFEFSPLALGNDKINESMEFEWECHWKQKQKAKQLLELLKFEKILKKFENNPEKEIKVSDQVLASFFKGEDFGISFSHFDPFEPILVSVDKKNLVTVYDYKKRITLNTFRNYNPSGTIITSSKTILHSFNPLLINGSNDGIIRIWKDFTCFSPKMIHAWNSNQQVSPFKKGSELKLEFQELSKVIYSVGDTRNIQSWDLETLTCLDNFDLTTTEGKVSCMQSDSVSPFILYCGFTDGQIKVFDSRKIRSLVQSSLNNPSSPPENIMEHSCKILSFGQQSNPNQLISGAVNGQIKFWDLRSRAAFKTLESFPLLSCLAIHPTSSLLLGGSFDQCSRLITLSGLPLSTLRYHDGVLGQRMASISNVSFHPFEPMFAVGCVDSHISIHTTIL